MEGQTLPPADLWARYPEIGIAVLFIIAIVGIFIFVWREYRKWAKEQEAAHTAENERQRTWQKEQECVREKQEMERAAEADRQRLWQAEQNKLREGEQARRDEVWRQFFEQLQCRQEMQINATNSVLGEISKQVNALTLEIRAHDIWAREAAHAPEPRNKRQTKAAVVS